MVLKKRSDIVDELKFLGRTQRELCISPEISSKNWGRYHRVNGIINGYYIEPPDFNVTVNAVLNRWKIE